MARRNLITLGLAGLGLTAGLLTEQRVLARARRRGDPEQGPAPLEGGRRRCTASDGAQLNLIETGQGRPFVLVHGVALSLQCWNNQLTDLCDDARVIAYDQRGHGDSLIGTEGLSLERLSLDLAELIEELDLFDAVLVGHSLGGMVVLRMLADNPKLAAPGGRVGALALVATSATPAAGRGIPGARALLAATQPAAGTAAWLASRLPGHTLPDSDMSFLLARLVFGAAPSAANVELTREITSRIPLGVSAELLLEILRFDAEATLGDIGLPTTIVVGTRDLMTPVRHARSLARLIPSAELVELAGCGHMPMLERRYEFDQALRDLAQRSAPGPFPRLQATPAESAEVAGSIQP